MKKLLLLITFTTIITSAFTQLNKGQFLTGGNISFSSSKYGDEDIYRNKATTFQVSPDIGYFIFDKLAVGGKVGLSFYKSTTNYEGTLEYSSNSVNLSPFVRYYILSKKQKINLFTEVDYTYIKTKEKNLGSSEVFKRTGSGYTVSAGPVLFLNPNVALELTLSYNSSKYKNDMYSTYIFMTGVGFQIHLGGKKN